MWDANFDVCRINPATWCWILWSLLMQALEITNALMQYSTARTAHCTALPQLMRNQSPIRPCPGHTHVSMSILSCNHEHICLKVDIYEVLNILV